MSKYKYSFFEQGCLDNIDKCLGDLKTDFFKSNDHLIENNNDGVINENNDGIGTDRTYSKVRVLTNDSNSVPTSSSIPTESTVTASSTNFGNGESFVNDSISRFNGDNNSGSSFVMIVVAIILLVFVVSIVTFGILNMLGK